MYMNKSAVKKYTLYLPKDKNLGQTFCNVENDPNIVKTEVYMGTASYGSVRKIQKTVWVVMNGILQKQFSGNKAQSFWSKEFLALMNLSIKHIYH